MPLYEFVCQKCGQEQELLVRGGGELTKLLSVPATPAAAAGPHGQSQPPSTGPCGSGCGCFPG